MKITIVLLLFMVTATGVFSAEPIPILFDTDMDTDCDDAGALAILHTLADRGEAEILATTISASYPWSAPCVAAINAYYGRPDLPIGVPKGKGNEFRFGSKYAKPVSEKFPTRIKTNEDAPNAMEVYRRILSARPDNSVVIVTVGDVTNIADLLESKPDRVSPLSGRELAKTKVKTWVCMGGRYPNHLDPKVYGNFKPDPASAVKAAREWPGIVVFTGLGDDIYTGAGLRETEADNPVRFAYEIYLGETPARPSWDPIAVLYAVRSDAPYWQIRKGGYNHIFDNGTNEWRDGEETHHRLLEHKPGTKTELQAELERLMTAKPER